MVKVKTKKRRQKENYEEYCQITLAYSNIHGKKFLNALKVILKDIKSRNFKPANSEDFAKLNKKVWKLNPVYGKDAEASIRKAIKKDKRFTYPGFGTFTVRNRKARKGRNPQTGEEIKINASMTVGFKPAPTLKNSL